MGRPPAKDLTERELEVMHVFWSQGEATAAEARDRLEATGLDRTYTTIANLVRGLLEKGFLRQVNAERPFVFPKLEVVPCPRILVQDTFGGNEFGGEDVCTFRLANSPEDRVGDAGHRRKK